MREKKEKSSKKRTSTQLKSLAVLSARLADAHHGESVELFNLEPLVPLGFPEYSVLVTANSVPHLASLAEFIRVEMKKKDCILIRSEIPNKAHWGILDYGFLIVHLFLADIRNIYQLDRLWEGSSKIAWKKASKKKSDSSIEEEPSEAQ